MRRRAKLNNKRQVKEGDAGLTRMFHTDRDEEAAKVDWVRQASILMQGCMCTYCPNQNVSLTQHPSDFPASVVDQYEISGLILPSGEITENRDSRIHGRSLPSINEKEEKGWYFKARCKKAP